MEPPTITIYCNLIHLTKMIFCIHPFNPAEFHVMCALFATIGCILLYLLPLHEEVEEFST